MKLCTYLFTGLALSSFAVGAPAGPGLISDTAVKTTNGGRVVKAPSSSHTGSGTVDSKPKPTQGTGTGTKKPNPNPSHTTTQGSKSGNSKHGSATGTSTGPHSSHTGADGGNSTAGGPPIWALNGATCNDLNFEKSGSAQWANVNGDKVMANFTKTFNSDAAYCHECLGLPVSQCKQAQKGNKDYNDHCIHGLKFESSGRMDQAAAHFADLPESADTNCGISDSGCGGDPPCDLANGPGTYAIVKSFETLHNIVNNVYDAMDTARGYCTTQMDQFSSDFAPPPPPTVPKWFALLNAFIGLAGGLVGSIEGYAVEGTLVAFSGSLSYGIMADTAQSTAPKDTGKIMGDIAQKAMDSMKDVVNGLVKDGQVKYKSKAYDGSTDMTLSKMFENGNYMVAPASDKDYKGELADQYQKVLFQQTAVYTWENLDNTKAIPFITFENQPCGKTNNALDDHIDNMNRDDSNVEIDGKCYYLLGATQSSQPNFGCGEEGTYSYTCDAGGTLPGGTKDILNGKAYSGLQVSDFVIPSVKGWEANNHQNGFKPAWQSGNIIKSIQQSGMVSIPVCDFVNNPKSPGDGCPKPGPMTENNGVCDSYKGSAIGDAVSGAVAGAITGVKQIGQGDAKKGDQKKGNGGNNKRAWNHKREEDMRKWHQLNRRC